MRTKTILLPAIFAISLISCKKNMDAPTTSGLDFQLRAINPSSVVNRTMSVIQWDSGFVNATEIRFEAKQNGNKTEFKSNVHQHVDLFSAISSIGSINIPTGTFDEVEFKVEAAANSTEPALKLQGTVNGVPLVFTIDNNFEFKAEQSPVTLNGTDSALNKIDLSGLTSGLSASDFANVSQTNGTIVISSTSNTTLFNMILNNLERQGETEVEVHHH